MSKKNACTHHWDIPAADGPTSRGICRHCNAEKDFQNGFITTHDPLTMSSNSEGLTLGRMQDHDAKSRIDELAAIRQIWMN